jgi:hypothetical protein
MSSKDDFSKWQRQIEELADHVEQDIISNCLTPFVAVWFC